MANKEKTPWEQIEIDEKVSEKDQLASDSVGVSIPVGEFMCTILECDAEEKDLVDYTVYVAVCQARIDCIIKLEQTIFDESGDPIIRNDEELKKILPVKEKDVEKMNAMYLGAIIPFDVFLYHHSEKANTKKRRLFVAKRIGIMSPQSTELKTKDWANAPGNKTVLTTEWNHWKDKDTDQPKKNVKVAYSGFDYPGNFPEILSTLDDDGAGVGDDDIDLDGI